MKALFTKATKKLITVLHTRLQQNKAIKKYDQLCRKLIVFLVPQKKKVNGGIMSMFSLCRESRKLKNIHNSEVLLATCPDFETYFKNELFKNSEEILRFGLITKYFKKLDSLILHIPECSFVATFKNMKTKEKNWLKKIPNLHINITNQNIELMPEPHEIKDIKEKFDCKITQTTAHDSYCNKEIFKKYKIPLHMLSVYCDFKEYPYKKWDEKENVIIISPDKHEKKALILEKIKNELPELKQIIIQGLSFEKYKRLISMAKYSITFGEGLDGYYSEPILCGGLSFAVYNNTFFPSKEFLKFTGIYTSCTIISVIIYLKYKKMD